MGIYPPQGVPGLGAMVGLLRSAVRSPATGGLTVAIGDGEGLSVIELDLPSTR